MILGSASASLIKELNNDLSAKTLEMASIKLGREFPRFVPWMSLVCLTDHTIVNTDILNDSYEKGNLIFDSSELARIGEFCETDARPILQAALAPRTGLHHSRDARIIKDLGESKDEWQRIFEQSRQWILEGDELFSEIFFDLVHFVVPIDTADKLVFSSHLARGAIFYSPPPKTHPEITMAIDIVHELGHQVLMIYQAADTLLSSSLDQPIWSAARQAYRPAIQCVQASIALTYMIVLVKNLLNKSEFTSGEREFLAEKYSSMVNGLDVMLADLNNNCEFTAIGTQIMREFGEVL